MTKMIFIVGCPGSGKSSLLKAICDYFKIDLIHYVEEFVYSNEYRNVAMIGNYKTIFGGRYLKFSEGRAIGDADHFIKRIYEICNSRKYDIVLLEGLWFLRRKHIDVSNIKCDIRVIHLKISEKEGFSRFIARGARISEEKYRKAIVKDLREINLFIESVKNNIHIFDASEPISSLVNKFIEVIA